MYKEVIQRWRMREQSGLALRRKDRYAKLRNATGGAVFYKNVSASPFP